MKCVEAFEVFGLAVGANQSFGFLVSVALFVVFEERLCRKMLRTVVDAAFEDHLEVDFVRNFINLFRLYFDNFHDFHFLPFR